MGMDGDLMDLPKTRAEALERGLKRYFTGKPCKRGHVAERLVSIGDCIECARNRYEADSEKVKERSRKWHQANPEKVRKFKRKYDEANREKMCERKREYYEANREKIREHHREYAKVNQAKYNALQKKRHATQLQAMPHWLTPEHHEQMADIYELAVIAEQLTGIKHHVDHIEPLQGEDRRGLHVPWNLQVLTATENISKKNRPIQHFHWEKV